MQSGKPGSLGLVVLCLLIVNCDKFISRGNTTENIWRRAGRLTGLLLRNCMQVSFEGPQEQFLLILQRCLERRSLVALDRCLKADVIKLASGIELVRYKNDTNQREVGFFEASYKSNEKEHNWENQVLRRIAHLLNTHILKIRLNGYEKINNSIAEEGRGKKKNNMFMSLLMFGMAAVGLIMVPMGFQFLAVLGGKALLIAKMALILTAIQGLKKIATSNLNYGLYATTPDHHHHHHPCKDELCEKTVNSLEDDDSDIFVSIDIDHLTDPNLVHAIFRHYDRQWPYESESHDLPIPHKYYQPPDHHPMDIFHPLQPRTDIYKEYT